MASSRVISSNSDLPRQSSLCSLTIADLHGGRNLGSMSMDDLLKNIYSDANLESPFKSPVSSSAAPAPSVSLPKNVGSKSVDEVWKEMVSGGSDQQQQRAPSGGDGGAGDLEEMTLEDFLAKAGAVGEEDSIMFQQQQNVVAEEGGSMAVMGFVNGIDGRATGGGGWRVKRRAVEEPPDKLTQQKQRRMIKNRESAARSRERKQAYTIELESLVTELEEENAKLLREEAEQTKERFKQLMENLIPVVEERKPLRVLRRVHSMRW